MSLKENQKIWNIHSVLNVLYSLVAKSNINQQVCVCTFSCVCEDPHFSLVSLTIVGGILCGQAS